jgi:hypothetical protein
MASNGSGSIPGMNKEPTCDDRSANPASILSVVGDDIPGFLPSALVTATCGFAYFAFSPSTSVNPSCSLFAKSG